MALDTVSDYIAATRVLLQDEYAGSYRYSDSELVLNLNLGLLEARRLRPDLFLGVSSVPTYTTGATGAAVAFDQQYRPALVFYMAGRCELKDAESTQDPRASALMNKFVAQLLVVQS